MKINAKISYGLRTMIELSMNAGSTGLLQKDIAIRQDIPIKYLDKIIAGLKASGLIVNVAGKKSGYILTRDAYEISLYDVYRSFEPELNIAQTEKDEKCAANSFWHKLNQHILTNMQKHKLGDLAKEQIKINNSNTKLVNFQI